MTNQIQAIALLPKLSEQQLLQVLQQNDGSVPSYAVMAELQSRKKRSASMAGPQMPTTTVKDDMAQEAGGLQSLGPAPTAPPQPQQPRGMAGGGAVGYDEYDEARRRYLESGGTDAPEETGQGWKRFRDWFANHPLLNGSYDEQRKAATPAPRGAAPAYMGPGTPGAGAATDAAPLTTPEPPMERPTRPAGGGLTSLRASASSKIGAGTPPPAGFDFKELQLRSIQDAMKDVPADGSLAEQIAAYKAQAGDVDKRRQDAKYEALMRAGLTMARTPGGLRSSIAAGGLEGLGAYSSGMKEASGLERERMKELAALQQAQSAQALQRYGIANSTRFGEAGIADKNQDNRFNAYKTGVESSDRRYAADAAVRAASIRADAVGSGGASNKVMALMLKADTDARASVDKGMSELDKLRMTHSDPAIRAQAQAAYEAKVQRAVLDKVGQMATIDPDLVPLYQQMRQQIGGAPAGGPAIIRGNGPPPGAVVRQ